MELKINEDFTKHYNEYRAKEEAAKTKKTLKRQIKKIEEELSSSSDSDVDEDYIKKYVDKCDFVLRQFQTNKNNLLPNKDFFKDLIPTKKTKIEKNPVYAKDLNRQILLEGGVENDKELNEIEYSANIDSDFIIKQAKTSFELNAINDDSDEDFLKPSTKPPKFVFNAVQNENSESESESYIENEEEKGINKPESVAIEINRDRKLETVRVAKTTTRSEKRKAKKERKEKELKEKLKKLKEIQKKSFQEKIDRIKKIVPQAAEESILDELEEDFDVNEISRKLTEFFERQDGSIPIDEEKPIFSDLSDIDQAESDSDQEKINKNRKSIKSENNQEIIDSDREKINKNRKSIKSENNQEIIDSDQEIFDKQKKSKSKKKEEKNKKNPFFSNVEIPDQKIDSHKKKFGIIQKSNEIFDPDRHESFTKFVKKNFDFLCEDLIAGKEEGEDIACRFKFRTVEQQDYGLDTEEILFSDRKELNKWASLKKITQIRTKAEEEKDRKFYEKIKERKREVLKSFYRNESDKEEEQEATEVKALSKAAKKRERKNAKKRLFHELLSGSEAKDDQNLIGSEINTGLDEPGVKKSKLEEKLKKIDLEKSDKIKIDSLEIDPVLAVPKVKESKLEKKSKKKNKLKKIDSEKSDKIKIDSSENDIGLDGINELIKTDDKRAENDVRDKLIRKSRKKNRRENDDNKSVKEGKQKKIKGNKNKSVPVVNSNRLVGLDIKEGFYNYGLKGTHK